MFECFNCRQKKIVWQSDFDAEDIGYAVKGIVSMYTCANCGAQYEMLMKTEEENEDEGKTAEN